MVTFNLCAINIFCNLPLTVGITLKTDVNISNRNGDPHSFASFEILYFKVLFTTLLQLYQRGLQWVTMITSMTSLVIVQLLFMVFAHVHAMHDLTCTCTCTSTFAHAEHDCV